ncbi:MAG: nitrous oxide reductase family maturation protein NosD [Candidatus Thorarchaeota archaeon]
MKNYIRILIIALGLIFTFISSSVSLPIFKNTRTESINELNLDDKTPKFSKISDRIFISGNIGWIEAKNDGICIGNGTASNPYIIEDLIIKQLYSTYSCIRIIDSDVFFIVQNCTLSYSLDAGISLDNVTNGQLINNNCSYNDIGILLDRSYNINISENIINYNRENGIEIYWFSNNIIIRRNLMEECSLGFETLTIEDMCSLSIDTLNFVNGKPIYYYANQTNLGPSNFTNPGQIILVNCNNSIISNFNISNGSNGIMLYGCNNSTISENTLCYNIQNGISLSQSNYNSILNNTVLYNSDEGILLSQSNYNQIFRNKAYENKGSITLHVSNYNNVTRNIVENNFYGISVSSSNFNRVSRNKAIENTNKGIGISGNYNLISGNTFSKNDIYGIWLDGNFNSILNNEISYNHYCGLFMRFSNNNTISNNTVNFNEYSGMKLSLSNYNTISGNTLIGNSVCISQRDCEGNIIENNYCQNRPIIFSFDLFYIFTIISVFIIAISFTVSKKIRKA